MALSIYDVAREAGVSVATVSRTFSRPERVSERTREHVLSVAQQIGFAPARRTASAGRVRKEALAVIVSDIANPHFFGLVRGAGRQAAAADSSMVLGETEHEPETERTLIGRLLGTVDGFVIAASRMGDSDLRDLDDQVPLALVDRELVGVPSVVIENDSGSRQVVEHLASLGHESLVFLAGPNMSWSSARRWASLEPAARSLNMSATRLGPFDPTIAGGAAAADAALVDGSTAIVAFNDLLALGVIQRLRERGVVVPEHRSVVSYDDIFGADFSDPPLTTLAAAMDKAGRVAVDIVLRRIREPGRPSADTRVVVPSRLVIRGSSGPAPGPAQGKGS